MIYSACIRGAYASVALHCTPFQRISACLIDTLAVDSTRAASRLRVSIGAEGEPRIPAISLRFQDDAEWHYSCRRPA